MDYSSFIYRSYTRCLETLVFFFKHLLLLLFLLVCSLIYFSELHIAMAPKDHKLGRLRQLQAFVRDPVRLQDLRGRSGDTLKAKLRKKVPRECTWQMFLQRTRFDADEQRVLDELSNLVTCRDDGLVGTSHGGASTTANTLDATTTVVPTVNSDRGNSLSTRKRARDKKTLSYGSWLWSAQHVGGR